MHKADTETMLTLFSVHEPVHSMNGGKSIMNLQNGSLISI